MAAKAHDLMAIDAPYGDFKDADGLKRSAGLALALGSDGKWVIHPGQIDCVNAVFTPSPEDVERAGKVIRAHEAAVRAGRGAVEVEGRLVDSATIRLARLVWDRARQLKSGRGPLLGAPSEMVDPVEGNAERIDDKPFRRETQPGHPIPDEARDADNGIDPRQNAADLTAILKILVRVVDIGPMGRHDHGDPGLFPIAEEPDRVPKEMDVG